MCGKQCNVALFGILYSIVSLRPLFTYTNNRDIGEKYVNTASLHCTCTHSTSLTPSFPIYLPPSFHPSAKRGSAPGNHMAYITAATLEENKRWSSHFDKKRIMERRGILILSIQVAPLKGGAGGGQGAEGVRISTHPFGESLGGAAIHSPAVLHWPAAGQVPGVPTAAVPGVGGEGLPPDNAHTARHHLQRAPSGWRWRRDGRSLPGEPQDCQRLREWRRGVGGEGPPSNGSPKRE